MTIPFASAAEIKAFVPVRNTMLALASAFAPVILWAVYREGGMIRLIKEPQPANDIAHKFKWRLFDVRGEEVHAWGTGERCYQGNGVEVPEPNPVLSEKSLRAIADVSDMVLVPPAGSISAYVFSVFQLEHVQAQWAEAVRCSESFNALCKAPATMEGMTADERTLYDYLANPAGPGSVPMVPSLERLVSALARRGLVRVTAEGYCRKTDFAQATPGRA